MSVAVLLWLDLCGLMAKLWVEGLKDAIVLPSLLYLVDRKLMMIFFTVKIMFFQLTLPMLNNIVDNICVASVPLHSDYSYQGGEAVEVLNILGVDVLQHMKHYSHEKLWVHSNRADFIKLPKDYISFGSVELFLSSRESKILCKRLVKKFVQWDKSSSNIVLGVKNRMKRRSKRTGVSDTVPNKDVNVKDAREKSSDVKKQNFKFALPKRVVGLYKYMVNCVLEPHVSQFDPLKEVIFCADVEHGLDNFYDLESIGIKDEGSLYEFEQVQYVSGSISFQDGHMPWNKDLVKQIPSNLKVSLAVTERIYKNL